MAKFSAKNIEFKDNQKAIFGTGDNSSIYWNPNNNELTITTVVSGVDPTDPGHLVTRRFVAEEITTLSGSIIKVHSELTGLDQDDHPQYVPRDGSRGFTSTVSGVEPVEDYELTTKGYLLGVLDGSISITPSGVPYQSLIQFHYETSLAESQTNSTSYVNKVSLTASGIPAGNYRIGWAFEWRVSKQNSIFYQQITMDDTEVLESYNASPYVDVTYWIPISNFYYYDNLVSGTHTLDLDYHVDSPASTAYIRQAKLEFWRIQ